MAGELDAVTRILDRVQKGDSDARDELIALVYGEVRRVAGGLLRKERPDHTLGPTELVHEALARILGGAALERVDNRRLLFATAAQVMRQVLVDHARARSAQKRGGPLRRVPLDDVLDTFEQHHLDVMAVHDALNALAALNARQSQVITLRFFAGLTMKQIAEQLGISLSTAEADFRLARAWLHAELSGPGR